MNEAIQTVVFSDSHRLTAKSAISLELSSERQTQGNEGMPSSEKLEADFLKAEALLSEMRDMDQGLDLPLKRAVS